MKLRALSLSLAVILPVSAGRASAQAERTLTAAQVPAAVRATITREWPAARVTKWSTEIENGKTMYEAETLDGATHRDVLLGAEGRIAEVETQVAVAALPAAVRAAATANQARIRRSEMVVMGNDTIYEFSIAGRRDELKLRPNGTPVPVPRN